MNSVVEAKVEAYLQKEFLVKAHDCGTVLDRMRSLARMAGFDLDEQFGEAGLAAGPEARVASRIVERALGGNGSETSDYEVRNEISAWIRTLTRKSR